MLVQSSVGFNRENSMRCQYTSSEKAVDKLNLLKKDKKEGTTKKKNDKKRRRRGEGVWGSELPYVLREELLSRLLLIQEVSEFIKHSSSPSPSPQLPLESWGKKWSFYSEMSST